MMAMRNNFAAKRQEYVARDESDDLRYARLWIVGRAGLRRRGEEGLRGSSSRGVTGAEDDGIDEDHEEDGDKSEFRVN